MFNKAWKLVVSVAKDGSWVDNWVVSDQFKTYFFFWEADWLPQAARVNAETIIVLVAKIFFDIFITKLLYDRRELSNEKEKTPY